MKENLFKKIGGDKITDIVDYIVQYLEKEGETGSILKSSNVEISIGCDSISKRKGFTYAIAIVFYNDFKHKGAHYVFKRLTIPKSYIKKHKRYSQWHFDEMEDFKHEDKCEMALNDLITSRLWNEVEYLMELGVWLDEQLQGKYFIKHSKNEYDGSTPYRLPVIHVDFNPEIGLKEQNKSNKLYNSAMGMLSGMGFKVVGKPNSWAASSAADMLCK